MTPMDVLGAVLALAVAIYLLVALVRAESF